MSEGTSSSEDGRAEHKVLRQGTSQCDDLVLAYSDEYVENSCERVGCLL